MNRAYIGTGFLFITLGYFLLKGLIYVSLGSFLPLFFILLVLILLVWTLRSTERKFSKTLKFWAILLIVWSAIRLLLFITDLYLKPVPEAHVHHQITKGFPLSLTILILGIYLFVVRKKIADLLFTKYKSIKT